MFSRIRRGLREKIEQGLGLPALTGNGFASCAFDDIGARWEEQKNSAAGAVPLKDSLCNKRNMDLHFLLKGERASHAGQLVVEPFEDISQRQNESRFSRRHVKSRKALAILKYISQCSGWLGWKCPFSMRQRRSDMPGQRVRTSQGICQSRW